MVVLSDKLEASILFKFYRYFTRKSIFKATPVKYLENLIAFLRYMIIAIIRIYLNRFLRRRKIKKLINRFRGKKVILIRTFAFPATDFSSFCDPVFETLSSYLKKQGYSVITLYEPLNAFKKSVTQFNPQDDTLSYFDFIRIRDIFFCLANILKSYFSTLKKSFFLEFEGTSIGPSFKSLYLWEHFSPSTVHAMTFYYLYKHLAKTFHIDRHYYTYENNSWERMALMALRRYSPQTRLIAHQQNVVPLASANLFYGKGEEQTSPRPDVILTTGEIPRKILQKYGHYNKIPIYPACAVRYNYLSHLKTNVRNQNRKILVPLDGTFAAAEVIKALFEQAGPLRNWEFIFRSHPNVSYEQLKTKISCRKNYPHFQLSREKDLKKELKNASIVLYWGSTVALEAIQLGPPSH